MKSIFTKRPTPEALRERIAILKKRGAKIAEEIASGESNLAVVQAQGGDIGPAIDVITRLTTEKNSIPVSIELLESELFEIEKTEALEKIQAEKAQAEKILKALRAEWVTVFDAFAKFKHQAKEAGIADLKGFRRSPAEILDGSPLPDFPALFEHEVREYYHTRERAVVNVVRRNYLPTL